jgi:hypothetical protein
MTTNVTQNPEQTPDAERPASLGQLLSSIDVYKELRQSLTPRQRELLGIVLDFIEE